MQRCTVDIEGCCGSSYETSFALAAVVEVQMALLMTLQTSASGPRRTKALEDDLEASGDHLEATGRALAVHFEVTWRTWGPLGVHLEATWRPLGAQVGLRRAQETAKSLPRAPRSTPRAPPKRARARQERPRLAEERPRAPQETPKSLQVDSKRRPRPTAELQDSSPRAPGLQTCLNHEN